MARHLKSRLAELDRQFAHRTMALPVAAPPVRLIELPHGFQGPHKRLGKAKRRKT